MKCHNRVYSRVAPCNLVLLFSFFPIDRNHCSRGPRSYFDDGSDGWTFLKKVLKTPKCDSVKSIRSPKNYFDDGSDIWRFLLKQFQTAKKGFS